MASLSDFKVSAQRDSRTPTLSPADERPQNTPGSGGGMVSKNADYAKVDKNHQSFKGKQGLRYNRALLPCVFFYMLTLYFHLYFGKDPFHQTEDGAPMTISC